MKNHDIFLTRLRWQSSTKEFKEMKSFSTDCFQYVFENALTNEQQNDFLSFIGDSNNLNNLTPIDFCNYFIQHKISFSLKFKYTREIGIQNNYKSYLIIKHINKKLISK